MDDPNITIEEYIRLEEEKARRRGKVYNWETATYGKIWDNEDVHDLGSVETEFPSIVFNDTLTSEAELSCEPTVSSLNNNEIDFRIAFDESDDEDCTIIFDKNSFSYKIISVNDLKTDSKNDDDKVNMPLFPSPKPTLNFILNNVVEKANFKTDVKDMNDMKSDLFLHVFLELDNIGPLVEIIRYLHSCDQSQLAKAFNERPQDELPSNTVPNPREEVKFITTQSGMTLVGPSVPPPPHSSSSKEVERDLETTTNQIPEQNPHQPPILYPSRLNKDKLQDKSDIRIHKFLKMFKKLHFNICFAEALAHMPKCAKMLKDLLNNKEKLLELANTLLNENCFAVLLKKLPKKLRDPGKFLIPCDFNELEEFMVLDDLGKFMFSSEFIVVHYDVDPRVPLILGRPFLKTTRALVYVHGEELILRVEDEKLTFNVDSTLKYPHKHGNESINMIDIIDTTCKDHFHKVLKVYKLIHPLSGSPTPSSDPIVASLFPSFTSFGDSDSLLEESDAILALESIPHDIDNGIHDSKGDILFLEKLLEGEPFEAKKSEINPLIREPSDTFLMGSMEIKFNPLEDIDNLVPILRVFEKPLDSLDPISETFDMTVTNPLFDFDSEFTLNSGNPIFDIQNEESDESETEIIMEEVQIHSSQRTVQIPPPSHRVVDILGPRLFFPLSYNPGLIFLNKFPRFIR
ncbi:hypothetical protein Tco_0597009 [Tanacetum coccineum]